MKELTKEDLEKIKYMRVISKNKILISYKDSEKKEIIKGKVFREKLHFSKEPISQQMIF